MTWINVCVTIIYVISMESGLFIIEKFENPDDKSNLIEFSLISGLIYSIFMMEAVGVMFCQIFLE